MCSMKEKMLPGVITQVELAAGGGVPWDRFEPVGVSQLLPGPGRGHLLFALDFQARHTEADSVFVTVNLQSPLLYNCRTGYRI